MLKIISAHGLTSNDERGGTPVQITEARWYGRGSEARLCCMYFCLSRSYNYSSTVQINPFRSRPTHFAAKSQSFKFSVKIFSRGGGGGVIFLSRGPNPLLAALGLTKHVR
jgi:hypothetical protein